MKRSILTSFISIDEPTTVEEISSESTPPPPPPSPVSDEPIVVDKILLVNTENVTHNEYEQTAELKVGEDCFQIIFHSRLSGFDCRKW